jgi:hypothetical protein
VKRQGRVVTVVASARNVDDGDIEKALLALRILRQQAASSERNAQRPDSMDGSALFDIQDPFQLGTHRPRLGEDDGAEVRTSWVSRGSAADSAMQAHCVGHIAYQTAKIR